MVNAMLLSLLLSSSVLAPAAQREGVDFATMRRDLEVMRRILDREVLGARFAGAPGAARNEALLALGYASHSRSGSQAFYVPGEGALFLTSVSYPVADSAGGREEAKEAPTLWDRVQAEVEGRPSFTGAKVRAYDAEAVERLKDEILLALAKYATNIGQLSASDHVTVVVTGSGPALEGYGTVVEPSSGLALFSGAPFPVATWNGRPSSVLAIRISLTDLRAGGTNGADAKALRARAQTAQY